MMRDSEQITPTEEEPEDEDEYPHKPSKSQMITGVWLTWIPDDKDPHIRKQQMAKPRYRKRTFLISEKPTGKPLAEIKAVSADEVVSKLGGEWCDFKQKLFVFKWERLSQDPEWEHLGLFKFVYRKDRRLEILLSKVYRLEDVTPDYSR